MKEREERKGRRENSGGKGEEAGRKERRRWDGWKEK